jgi:hypothetical protein
MTAQFLVDLHDEWMEISLNVPAEDFDKGLELFVGILQNPLIDKGNIERAPGNFGPEEKDLGGESGAQLYQGSMEIAVDHVYEILSAGPMSSRIYIRI